MKSYEDLINSLEKRTLNLTISTKNSLTKYYTFHGIKYYRRKFEMKPLGIIAYYSRYVEDPFAYKEFDFGSYLLRQFRETYFHSSFNIIHIVKKFNITKN